MSKILVTGTQITRRSEFGEKKLRCGRGWWRPSPWPRRLAPSRGTAVALQLRRRQALRSPRCAPVIVPLVPCAITHHVPQRQPPTVTLGKALASGVGGGAIPICPRRPNVLRAQKHTPLKLPAPLVGMTSSHVAISDVRSCVPGAPFVAVLRVLASPSATPKCLSGTSTWGTAAVTRSHDFQVKNAFPECNTPLISAHGALSSTPCC